MRKSRKHVVCSGGFSSSITSSKDIFFSETKQEGEEKKMEEETEKEDRMKMDSRWIQIE